MICFRIKQSETNLIAPILPTVMTIVIDMIVQDGFRFIIAHKNAQKKRNPKTYVEFKHLTSLNSVCNNCELLNT